MCSLLNGIGDFGSQCTGQTEGCGGLGHDSKKGSAIDTIAKGAGQRNDRVVKHGACLPQMRSRKMCGAKETVGERKRQLSKSPEVDPTRGRNHCS